MAMSEPDSAQAARRNTAGDSTWMRACSCQITSAATVADPAPSSSAHPRLDQRIGFPAPRSAYLKTDQAKRTPSTPTTVASGIHGLRSTPKLIKSKLLAPQVVSPASAPTRV